MPLIPVSFLWKSLPKQLKSLAATQYCSLTGLLFLDKLMYSSPQAVDKTVELILNFTTNQSSVKADAM